MKKIVIVLVLLVVGFIAMNLNVTETRKVENYIKNENGSYEKVSEHVEVSEKTIFNLFD